MKSRRWREAKSDDLVAFLESLSPDSALPTPAVPSAIAACRAP